MIHPHLNLGIARSSVTVEDADPQHKEFLEGAKFTMPSWLLRVFYYPFKLHEIYEKLVDVYPLHPVIAKAAEQYQEGNKKAIKQGLIVSAISVFSIYQMGRRGIVLPFFKQYMGRKSIHRLFAHYSLALTLPTITFLLMNYNHHSINALTLWEIHSRRLNAQMLDDPKGTVYSATELPIDMAPFWNNPYVDPLDLETKVRNETELSSAPDYTNPEFQAVQIPEAEGEGQEGQGGEDQE